MRDRRNVVTKSGVVYLIDEDTEEGGGLFIRVLLELRLNLDDECRRHCGKQTSL